jgi:hypothetical protein
MNPVSVTFENRGDHDIVKLVFGETEVKVCVVRKIEEEGRSEGVLCAKWMRRLERHSDCVCVICQPGTLAH